MGKQQTKKKVKYLGTEQFLNLSTGTIEDFNVTGIEERDFNFHKVWMRNFISTLDIVGNQKTRLCFWIIDNLNRENQLLYTYRQIAEKTNISLDTVRLTMGILLDSDFLRRRNQGCYIVNPDMVFKGTRSGRLNILNQYQDAELTPLSDEEKLRQLVEAISKLQKQAEQLAQRIAETKDKEPAPVAETEEDETDQVPNQMNVSDYGWRPESA